jgi:hypothetical protein
MKSILAILVFFSLGLLVGCQRGEPEEAIAAAVAAEPAAPIDNLSPIIIAKTMAETIKKKPGDKLTVAFSTMKQGAKPEVKVFRVLAVFEAADAEVDMVAMCVPKRVLTSSIEGRLGKDMAMAMVKTEAKEQTALLVGIEQPDFGVAACKKRVDKVGGERMKPKSVADWYKTKFDDQKISLDVRTDKPWKVDIPWANIERVCLKSEGDLTSDGIYIFVRNREASYVVPVEADGGSELLFELAKLDKFSYELISKASVSPDGLFCYPDADAR